MIRLYLSSAGTYCVNSMPRDKIFSECVILLKIIIVYLCKYEDISHNCYWLSDVILMYNDVFNSMPI